MRGDEWGEFELHRNILFLNLLNFHILHSGEGGTRIMLDDLYLISQGDEIHVQLFHTVVGAQLGDLDQGRVAGGHTLLDSAQPRGTARRHRL